MPDHQAKSRSVAGPWLRRYRSSSSAMPSSRSSSRDSGIHSSKATTSCCLPGSGPWTSQPRWQSIPSRWIPRWPAVGCPAAWKAWNSSSRVAAPPPETSRSAASRAAWTSSEVMPSSRWRPAMPRIMRPDVRSSIQRRSSGASRCSVPRIGQERTISARSSAERTSSMAEPGTRWPTAHRAAWRSCACIAVIHRTASGTVPRPGPTSPCEASRSRPMMPRLSRGRAAPAMDPW